MLCSPQIYLCTSKNNPHVGKMIYYFKNDLPKRYPIFLEVQL